MHALKLTLVKCDRQAQSPLRHRLLAHSKNDLTLTKGLTAVVVLLPQALVFTAASGVEFKTELYTVVVVATVAAALIVSRSLQGPYLGKSLKGKRCMESMTDQPKLNTDLP